MTILMTLTRAVCSGYEVPPHAKPLERWRNRWRHYNVYDVTDWPKRAPRRKVKPANESIPLTPENVAEALYVVNKSAKKSRDTKSTNYELGRHGHVSRAKSRQNDLYTLKDRVLAKAIIDGNAMAIGYAEHKLERWCHLMKCCPKCDNADMDDLKDRGVLHCWGGCAEHCHKDTAFLTCYLLGGKRFHRPADCKPENLPFLGELPMISAESHSKMRLTDALALLGRYLKQPIKGVSSC